MHIFSYKTVQLFVRSHWRQHQVFLVISITVQFIVNKGVSVY